MFPSLGPPWMEIKKILYHFGNWDAAWRSITFLIARTDDFERRNGCNGNMIHSQMMIIPETPDRPTIWTRLSLHKDISSRSENYEYTYIELHSPTLDPKLERRDIPIKNACYKGRQYLKISFNFSLPANILWDCDEDFRYLPRFHFHRSCFCTKCLQLELEGTLTSTSFDQPQRFRSSLQDVAGVIAIQSFIQAAGQARHLVTSSTTGLTIHKSAIQTKVAFSHFRNLMFEFFLI